MDVLGLSLWTLRIKKNLNCVSYPVTWLWKHQSILSPLNVFCEQIRQMRLFLSFISVRWQATLTYFHIFCYFYYFLLIFVILLFFIWCSILDATLDVSQSNEQKGV